MNQGGAMNPDYSRYHPKWYRKRFPIFWWLRKPAYTRFIVRELTSVFVAYSAALLLVQVWAVGQGPGTYERVLGWLEHPLAIGFHALVLLALLFHSVTWLNLAPKALVLRLGERRVPPATVLVGHYAAWIGVSAVLAWLLVGGA